MNKLKLRRNQESVNNKPANYAYKNAKMLTNASSILNLRKCELRDNEKTD